MAVITPNTDLYLLKVPLEMDEVNQLTFANATAQYNYFNSLPKLGVDDFTYQRKDGTIRFAANFDDCLMYNYVMYRNTEYSDKWFYAYITDMQYMNDSVTAITIKTDVWMTWCFELNYKPVFVEREHVNDDTVGANTVPENVELGEYEIVDLRNSPLWESEVTETDWLPCFCVTAFPSTTTNLQADGRVQGDGGYIGGVYSSLKFFCPINLNGADHIIEEYENDNQITTDAIVNIYMVPRCCVNRLPNNFTEINGIQVSALYNFYTSDVLKLQQPSVLAENYQPVNQKLLTYPYSYFYVTNNSGDESVFHYEDFPFETIGQNRARTITYQKSIVPSTSLSAKLYFTNYKSYAETAAYGTKMYNYGINYGKIPVCAWTTDYYTNWLTQNGINVGTSLAAGIAGSVLGMGASAVSGNAVGFASAAIGLGQTIGNTIGEIHRAESTPPQAHGDIATGDFNFCFKRNSISFYEMSIRPEMARIIDGYFSMFGYQVNRVKIPNITGRRNWNYVKTQGCYIDADIPQSDLDEIKKMFDRGVTFWHNPATFADYSQANDII